MSKSHARRFVQSAWALLAFQLIASVGAVAVTGAAALYVQRLAAERDTLRAEAEGAPAATVDADPLAETPGALEPGPPADAAAPAAPAAPAAVQPCPRSENLIRVPANIEWCDTGITLRQGGRFAVRAQGRWSNAGEPLYGPEGIENYRHPGSILETAALSSLIGRDGGTVFAVGQGGQMVATADGPLHLSMNDTPGGFYDNQGYVDVFVYVSE